MEKRVILAAILMAAILMLYQALFVAPPSPEREEPRASRAPGDPAPPAPPGVQPPPAVTRPVAPPAVGVPPVAEAPPPVADAPEKIATVETPLYRARISSVGGAVVEWGLKYRGEKPMVLPGVVGSRGLAVRRAGGVARPIPFTLSTQRIWLARETPQGRIQMTGEDGQGLRVTQELRFWADSYVVDRIIRVENRHAAPQGVELEIGWHAPVEWPKEHEAFRGPRPISVVMLERGSYWARRVWLADAVDAIAEGHWVGFESGVAPTGQNGVYLTALIPRAPEMKVLEGRASAPGARQAMIGVEVAVPVLQPGHIWEGHIESYVGPMELDRLTAARARLDKAIYFGGFPFPESWAQRWGMPTIPMEWVVVPVLKFMNWLYGIAGNYGIAIIVLTIVTKLLFFPLSVKSMKSMKAMQAIQPQVNALRAKYKSDPQRMQRETMDLYRQHKVNPLGGCLPMVVQVPVFYALYVALSVSPDLQNSPFVCFGRAPSWIPGLGGSEVWICDLATYDPTYVLPILMGVSMFVQQRMMPVMGDPRQAKLMLMMPILFTFMFLNLPSGLVLYWTLSNVLQIGQQYYMDRGGLAARTPTKTPKKV